jgi:hypothetical protein
LARRHFIPISNQSIRVNGRQPSPGLAFKDQKFTPATRFDLTYEGLSGTPMFVKLMPEGKTVLYDVPGDSTLKNLHSLLPASVIVECDGKNISDDAHWFPPESRCTVWSTIPIKVNLHTLRGFKTVNIASHHTFRELAEIADVAHDTHFYPLFDLASNRSHELP